MTFAIGDRVEYGLGRLGVIASKPKIKWRVIHYLVKPLSITTGDGFLPAWYPELRIKVGICRAGNSALPATSIHERVSKRGSNMPVMNMDEILLLPSIDS